jgi:succinate-semialdehyde dehydrogenase/glutarate-semialdehyde dehydrogenase
MPVWTEETFGPVAPIVKAQNIEEALMLANNSRFGLASCVVTEKPEVFDYFAQELQT